MQFEQKIMDENKDFSDYLSEELDGEEYVPNYVCMKREVVEEEICESEISSCSELRTTTGNILERMIRDPFCRRPPCLGKWPELEMNFETVLQENVHQFKAAQQPTTLKQMCSLTVTSDPNTFRQPAIIGTLGPASSDVNSVLELIEAGMNIVRISMSHTSPCSKTEAFQIVIEANNQYKTIKDYNIPIAIMMDLKGPQIRTGRIQSEQKKNKTKEICIKQGTIVKLTSDEAFSDRCSDKIIYIDYKGTLKKITPGSIIYISDGEIKLVVDVVENETLVCRVEKGGKLKSNQRVHMKTIPLMLPALTEYDKECLELGVKMDVDIISVPVTRNSEVIEEVRKLLVEESQENNNIAVLATISTYEGLENLDSILKVADGIIIQKNDLCLDIGPEKIFIAQKEIIAKCNRMGKPVLCTAQLSSVESSDNAFQRIEINDIGGAIVDGADGIILISETALGDHALQAVTQLSNIIREAEAATMQKPFYFDLANELVPSVEPVKAIAMAAVQIANKIQASAILTVTTTGRTAQMLSWFRPRCPVIAMSRVGRTARQMNLWRAVIPLHFSAPVLPDWFLDVKARFDYGIAYGKSLGIIQSGDLLVLVSGFRKKSGFTNSIRIVFASLENDGFLDNVPKYYSQSKDSII